MATVEPFAARLPLHGDGVHWTLADPSDLNANLVHLDPTSSVAEHINTDVDVVLVVVAGDGVIDVDGRSHTVTSPTLAHVRKGARRAIRAGDVGLTYVTVHRRRAGPNLRGRDTGAAFTVD